MNILTEAHKKLLVDLLNGGVEFLLIGGYAVNYHGYPRYTMDMDLWLNPSDTNKEQFITFLQREGFLDEGINHLKKVDFSTAQVFHIGEQETRIDFLTKLSGVEFNEAYNQCAKLPIGNKIVPVIQYEHLMVNKMLSGRAKDKADVDELQKIRKYKSD